MSRPQIGDRFPLAGVDLGDLVDDPIRMYYVMEHPYESPLMHETNLEAWLNVEGHPEYAEAITDDPMMMDNIMNYGLNN